MLTSYAGAEIFGESYGTGSPSVLALHGWRRDHNDFVRVLTEPEEVAAIALDLPGFGGTPAPPEAWGSPEYAAALAPVLKEMDDTVIVLAHSFGARVAVHLAAEQPDRVAGLVLTGAPLFAASGKRRRPPLKFRVVRRLASAGIVPQARLDEYRERYGSADYRAASGVMRDVLVKLLNEDYRDVIAALECPVELVWGDDDTAAPLPVAERIRDTLPNGARLSVSTGAGHLTPLTVPAELRAAIERLKT